MDKQKEQAKPQRRAARLLCRERLPDFFFASHLLPRPRRLAAGTVAAVALQLGDILHFHDEADCQGQTEPMDKKRAVCSAVLEHLYSGQPTGKPELDGFADVANRLSIERELFETMCDGLASLETTRRYPTWARLSGDLERAGGSAAVLAARALGADRALLNEPTAARQVRSWGAGLHLTRLLLGLSWDLSRGLLRPPLDDLVKSGVTESRLRGFAEARTSGGDVGWAALMRQQTTRARNLLRGGSNWFAALPERRSQRAAAAAGALYLALLNRIDSRAGDVFGARIELNFWDRLGQLPRAVRSG